MLDRKTFYAYCRRAPFGGRLTQQQVDGINCVLSAWEDASPEGDIRHLAYIFATAFHETGGTMAPVREGFAKTDSGARKIVAKYKYGKPDKDTGHVYYGRGLVQLTWATNYRRMSGYVGVDLYSKPDLALDPAISAKILVVGMLRGLFTGDGLREYFNDSFDDAVGARKIVNGRDKAHLIAGYHAHFLAALKAADTSTPMPEDVSDDAAKADKPSLVTDKTLWGTATSVLGAGGTGIFGMVDNPWAFAFAALVLVGVGLFLTGRLEIRRKAGA